MNSQSRVRTVPLVLRLDLENKQVSSFVDIGRIENIYRHAQDRKTAVVMFWLTLPYDDDQQQEDRCPRKSSVYCGGC